MSLRHVKQPQIPTIQILSQKELEREFGNMIKVFEDKETELNWEAREKALTCTRGILRSDCIVNWRATVLQGIHDLALGIVKAMDSLRTSLTLEALDLVSDISIFVGYNLDFYTFNTLLSSLLRRSSTTKHIIAAHTKDTTLTLLSNTSYHSKVLHLIVSTLDEKNSQARHYATIYMNAFLDTHGRREHARIAIERSSDLDSVEAFLKKGLLDATPFVRESCRQTFWTFRSYWPSRAERMYQTLDRATHKQLERTRSNRSCYSASSIDRSESQSISSSGLSRPTSRPTSTLLSRTPSYSRLSTSSSVYKHAHLPPSPSSTQSAESRQSLLTRKNSGKTSAAPASEISKMYAHHLPSLSGRSDAQPLRRPRTAEAQKEAALASVKSLLRMLQSSDAAANCSAIRRLTLKLRDHRGDSTGVISLPPDIPSRVDLLPLLMKYLSEHDLEIQLYEELMSWDSLTNLLVPLLSIKHYVPILIITSREHTNSKHARASHRDRIAEVYAKGLQRLKLYLKHSDLNLAKSLLDILIAVTDGSAFLDSGARRDMLTHPEHREELLSGLIQWMDELVCDYIGLGEDDDGTLLAQGSSWLCDFPVARAHQWFDEDQNLQSCLTGVLKIVQSIPIKTATRGALTNLIGRLRLANERVFESVTRDNDPSMVLPCAQWNPDAGNDCIEPLQVDAMSPPDLMLEEGEMAFTKEQAWDPTEELESVGNASTGMTEDISKIKLEFSLISGNDSTVAKLDVSDTAPVLPATKRIWPPGSTDEAKVNGTLSMSLGNKNDSSVTDGFKRRKRNAHCQGTMIPDTIEERTRLIHDGIQQLQEPELTHDRIFRQLQALSQATPVLQPWREGSVDTGGIALWKSTEEDDNVIVPLVEALIAFLSGPANESSRVDALVLIKFLLKHQSGLFEQITTKPPCLTSDLARALVACKVDLFSSTSTAAEDAFGTLLRAVPHQTGLDILMHLLQMEIHQNSQSTPSLETQLHPLSTLFSHLSDLVPKIPNQLLEEFLNHGAADLLLKGYNHRNVSVRKSCVQVLVSIHSVLGDTCLKAYFATLRGDQMDLLQHYISLAEKADTDCK